MDTRKELHVTNLDEVFEPKSCISDVGSNDKWRRITYTATEFSGTVLSSFGTSRPEDISYDPGLTGWYKIYLQVVCVPGFRLHLKLTSDAAFTDYLPPPTGDKSIVDDLWRCADMTGQSLTITRRKSRFGSSTAIAGLRFVPMSEEEVALYKYEASRPDTKRLYATDDMHNRVYCNPVEDYDDWKSLVLPFKDSDVEWLSLEEIRVFASGKCPTDPDDYGFVREGDRQVQKQLAKFDYDKVLSECVKLGHEIGLKMSVSIRMGAWGMGYPYDQCYFDCDFFRDHPELHCIDRNGDEISAMSYAFPETRKFMIDTIVNMARSGCDAVTLIAHRGIPYVLFEQPVIDRYVALYGEDPRNLPLENPRLNKLHCDIMTEFFAEVREALDNAYGKGKIRMQLRAMDTIRYTKHAGIDPEELAKRGLAEDIIVFPQAVEELYTAEGVLVEDEETGEPRINMEKYNEYVHGPATNFRRAYTDQKLLFENPEESVPQWVELEKKYGVKLYFEIMPRFMPNADFKKCALRLYGLGAERFALWDTYGRVVCKNNWRLIGKLGHKEELPGIDPDERLFTRYKILRYGDIRLGRYYQSWGG